MRSDGGSTRIASTFETLDRRGAVPLITDSDEMSNEMTRLCEGRRRHAGSDQAQELAPGTTLR